MAGSDLTGSAGDLGAGIGGLLGGVLGYFLGAEDRARVEANLQAGRDMWAGIDPQVRAEVEQVVDLDPSAFEDVSSQVDPAARAAQVRSYEALAERGLSGGMDAQSQSALSEAMTSAAQADSANRQSLQDSFAARGRGGGMSEFASQLQGQQAAAENNYQAGTRAAADASARAYQALAESGSLAGQVRGQDYQQASDVARARDIVAQHNARNRQDVYSRNANRAQDARSQTTDNRFRQAAGYTGQLGQENAWWDEQQKDKRRVGQGIGSGAGRLAGMAVGGGF